jgi:group I intron endonuclease
MYKIYKLVNIINNKIYVGQTYLSLEDRFGKGYKGCYYLENAIKKYGKENFKYEILCLCSDQDTANYLEKYYIEELDSRNHSIGYNIREGGSNSKISEETKKKMSVSAKGRKLSDEHKNKIAKTRTGQKHTDRTKRDISKSLVGISRSEETRQKMSASKKESFVNNPELKIKISAAFKGVSLSEEHKKKLSESHKGKTWKLVEGKRVWSQK